MLTMNEKTEKNIRSIKVLLIIMLILAILGISKVASTVTTRILLSVFIFLLVLPLVTALEKAKVPAALATVIAVLVMIVVVLFFVWFVFFTVDLLIQKVPAYSDRINDLDGLLTGIASRWIEIPENTSFFSTLNIDWVGGVIMPVLRQVSSSAISIVSNVVIIILMTVFLLGERHMIVPKFLNFVEDEENETLYSDNDRGKGKVSTVWDRIVRQVSRYISIKVFVSVITGILFYLIAIVIKLDFALLWGVMAIIMNFIPTIGSILITVLMILMSLIQFAPSLGPIIFVAVSTILVQNIIGNFLDPKLSGNSLNLSPFIILVALAIFGFLWGIVGMFLAVPLLSVVQIICANVDYTRPVAMLISSGRSYKKQDKERMNRRRVHKAGRNGKGQKGQRNVQNEFEFADDIMFPDRDTTKPKR
ncbi:MAG: AI-2E family transporter [Spirochaetales bacterium]|nr:AI-2E family transporter [Spirochaetales bacterium]